MKKIHGSITGRDEGFTLIELMIVVLIIAILIAIAIPTFLGARERAQDRAAQSGLRNALTAENVYYTDSQWFTIDFAEMGGIEQSLQWVAASTNQNQIVPEGAGDNNGANANEFTSICLSNVSAHGDGFVAKDVKVMGGTTGEADTGSFYGNAPQVGVAGWSFGCAANNPNERDSTIGWRH